MNRRSRLALIAGLTVFLTATGATTGYALWSTSANTLASVKAATVLLTADGTAATQLSSEYRPGQSVTAPITVTNGGNVELSYTAAVSAPAGSALANQITITVWRVATAAACTSGSSPSGIVWTGTLAGFSAAPSDSLGVGVSQVLCVRTALASNVTAAQQGESVAAVIEFTGSNGWQSSSKLSFKPLVFTVPNPVLKADGGCLNTSDESFKNITLNWEAVPGASEFRFHFHPLAPTAPVPAYMTVPNGTTGSISGDNYDTYIGSVNTEGSVTITAVVDGWESRGLVQAIYFEQKSNGSNKKISCDPAFTRAPK